MRRKARDILSRSVLRSRNLCGREVNHSDVQKATRIYWASSRSSQTNLNIEARKHSSLSPKNTSIHEFVSVIFTPMWPHFMSTRQQVLQLTTNFDHAFGPGSSFGIYYWSSEEVADLSCFSHTVFSLFYWISARSQYHDGGPGYILPRAYHGHKSPVHWRRTYLRCSLPCCVDITMVTQLSHIDTALR